MIVSDAISIYICLFNDYDLNLNFKANVNESKPNEMQNSEIDVAYIFLTTIFFI